MSGALRARRKQAIDIADCEETEMSNSKIHHLPSSEHHNIASVYRANGQALLDRQRQLLASAQQTPTPEATAAVAKQQDSSRKAAAKRDAGWRFWQAGQNWNEGTLHRIMCKPTSRRETILITILVMAGIAGAAHHFLNLPPF